MRSRFDAGASGGCHAVREELQLELVVRIASDREPPDALLAGERRQRHAHVLAPLRGVQLDGFAQPCAASRKFMYRELSGQLRKARLAGRPPRRVA
jgi:hypothetical protein